MNHRQVARPGHMSAEQARHLLRLDATSLRKLSPAAFCPQIAAQNDLPKPPRHLTEVPEHRTCRPPPSRSSWPAMITLYSAGALHNDHVSPPHCCHSPISGDHPRAATPCPTCG